MRDELRDIPLRGRLIAISGLDGSGKSTQVEMLAAAVTAAGGRARPLWFRPGYSVELDFTRSLVRRFSRRILPTQEQSVARERAFATRGVSESWVALALADTLLQCAAKIRIWQRLGYTVICDRYVHDALIDLELRFPQHEALLRVGLSAVRVLVPEPVTSLLLVLPGSEAIRRSLDKNEPFPEDAEMRERRREKYEGMLSSGIFLAIDANRPRDEVHREIVGVVRDALSGESR